MIFYHNTVTTETSAATSANSHWRNNLMLGQGTAPAIFSVNTSTAYSSSDYNGFRPNPGAKASFQWNVGPAPAAGSAPPAGFVTLADYTKATGQDQHSITLDYDIFVNVPPLDAQKTADVQKLYRAEDFDFRLKAGAAAIDKGTALPNVTDGFAGRAPDLGALEVGKPAPHYGPRP